MNKTYLCKRNKYLFYCFKFILFGMLVANLFRGSFFGGRDYYAIWVLPRSSSSSVILLSSSGEARGNVPALCLTKMTVSDGQVFRFGTGSLLCRFSAKKRPISFVLYPQINPTARFDGGQNGVRRLCKTSFTAVLCRLHIVRTNCIYPCEAAAFARIRTCFERRYY